MKLRIPLPKKTEKLPQDLTKYNRKRAKSGKDHYAKGSPHALPL